MSGASAALAEGPYTYDPYGNCLAGASACSSGEPYRFTGRHLDPETGLSYYRARYYSSALGRFLQTDPVGYTADLDLYTYVGNEPVTRRDPFGLWVCGSDSKSDSGACGIVERGLAKLASIENKLPTSIRRMVEKLLRTFGKKGDKGVTVVAGRVFSKAETSTDDTGTTVTINTSLASRGLDDDSSAMLVAHEGTHAVDQRAGLPDQNGIDRYRLEQRAFTTESFVGSTLHNSGAGLGPELWNPNWTDGQQQYHVNSAAWDAVPGRQSWDLNPSNIFDTPNNWPE